MRQIKIREKQNQREAMIRALWLHHPRQQTPGRVQPPGRVLMQLMKHRKHCPPKTGRTKL